MNQPDIFEFDNPRNFIQKVIEYRKTKNPSTSIRSFCRQAGFRNPSTLNMVILGKRRFTPALAERLNDVLNLSGRRRTYFMKLAALETANSVEQRTRIKQDLFILRELTSGGEIKLKQYRFLSVWFYPVIFVMVGQRGFREDPPWIASRLGQGVSTPQVELAITDMIDLGLLQREDDFLKQGQGRISTDEDVREISVVQYHRNMIQRSLDSLNLPMDLREFNGLTVGVPASRLVEVKEKIRNFRREMNVLLSQTESTSENVFQLNIQFFPLTRDPEKREVKS